MARPRRKTRGRSRDGNHPPNCGCAACRGVQITLNAAGSQLELGPDPDTMEDEDQPFFWNRHP